MFKTLITLILSLLSALNLHFQPAPCSVPVTYSIGNFDPRFNLSRREFINALTEAESIWEKTSGLNLFAYSTSTAAKLPVNLIYDYRQQATEELSAIKSDAAGRKAAYISLQSKYQNKKGSYEGMKSAYEAEVAGFNARSLAYQAEVDHWNNGPRTSQEEFRALESSRLALESEAARLKTEESALNALVEEINSLADQLNALAKELNLDVDQYNTIGEERGEQFTGGLYIKDNAGERINIYEFSSREKLVRILAHELGHALGLEHVDDPKAIMYKLNEGEKGALTQADITELKRVCHLK